MSDEPAEVFEQLLKTCQGAVAEAGDVCRIRVGPPGLPVHVITDDDVIVARPQDFDPFPGLDQTFNAIHASHPAPEALWEATDAPARYDAALEAEDGARRLVADLSLPAAPYATQVQRIMRAALLDHRRMRRHTLSLPPEAMVLEPLDTLTWSSARNGYAAKLFEVGQQSDETLSLVQVVALREVDPADYDWVPGYALPVTAPPSVVVVPVAAAVPGSAPSVTNNAATWTTVCSFDLTTPVGCYVQGTIFARWTVAPLSLPVGFEMAVLVGGVTMVALNQTTLALDNNLFFFAPFTRQGVPAGTTPVVFQIRNAGGQGVFQSNLQAIAGMK